MVVSSSIQLVKVQCLSIKYLKIIYKVSYVSQLIVARKTKSRHSTS